MRAAADAAASENLRVLCAESLMWVAKGLIQRGK
jgi:hypothetical protein